MSEMDNLDALLDGPRTDLIPLDSLLTPEEWAELKNEPRECCGLPDDGPDGNYGDLVSGVCSAGHCTVLYCPCGVATVSFGPVGCPCSNEVTTDGE
jgi:hypothetical protein